MPSLKKLFLSSLLALLVPCATRAADDLASIETLMRESPPWLKVDADGTRTVLREPTNKEMFLWMTEHARKATEAALAYYDSHPQDPDRWKAALLAIKTNRMFVKDVIEDPKLPNGYRIVDDEAAAKAWSERMTALEQTLLAAPDVPDEVFAGATVHAVNQQGQELYGTVGTEMAAMKTKIDRLAARAPANSPALAAAYEPYLDWVAMQSPPEYHDLLAQLAQSKNTELATYAAGRRQLLEAKKAPLDLKFTAVDGREVDLAKLRGKVVLVDFWATWCGPCKMELPNVKDVYDRYHDKGFEVVAISLDSEKDKQKLIDYCTEKKLPWPQFFDGRGWHNELAVKYSIRAIPAMFLLNQDGVIATTEARGPALETEVKRLLGL